MRFASSLSAVRGHVTVRLRPEAHGPAPAGHLFLPVGTDDGQDRQLLERCFADARLRSALEVAQVPGFIV